jgi:hypothetical protein
MKRVLLIIAMILVLTGCDDVAEKNSVYENEVENNANKQVNEILNENGNTIKERYNTPEGFQRIDVEDGSFGEFLRKQKLKPYGEKVLYYDGREKPFGNVYDSVLDVDIGDRDLHQCADAVMLLRAEYLYSIGEYDEIKFNFVSGFEAKYSEWIKGNRIKIEGNNASYYKKTEPSNTYEDFRNFMDIVFAYSSTLSLENELESIEIDQMKIGDVFIVGGSPGHAVIVVDMAENENGEKIFLLAQSYMPAQQTQILLNPNDKDISPWYSLKGYDKLVTPQWTFELDQLKRFN